MTGYHPRVAQDQDRKARRRWRIAGWIFWLAFFVYVYLVPTSWRRQHPTVEIAVLAAVGMAILLLAFARIAAFRRSRREAREARATGHWPLGKAYLVGAEFALGGSRRGAELTIGETEIVIETIEAELPVLPATEWRIPTADVHAVRVRPAWIEIATADRRVRVVPSSYQDRQRLLWELALRCNAAVERGIDEAAAEASAKAESSVPSRIEDGIDPTGMGGATTGLGSALAGPMTPRNPAPPRKSGLGVGLFPAPPGEPGAM